MMSDDYPLVCGSLIWRFAFISNDIETKPEELHSTCETNCDYRFWMFHNRMETNIGSNPECIQCLIRTAEAAMRYRVEAGFVWSV